MKQASHEVNFILTYMPLIVNINNF